MGSDWGSLLTVNTGSAVVTSTYDALGRMVENNVGGVYTQIVYGPTGAKVATAHGQTLIKAFVALPGGAKAIYDSTGTLAYYRHSDWLGSSRLTSTQGQVLYSSSAYAPFGEQYANAGTADASFTGQDQDTVSSLYDFLARRQSPSQGRWISPDPSGRSAVSMTKPQSWNRYAYALNNPLALTDSMGLSVKRHRPHSMWDEVDCDDDECGGDGGGEGDGGTDGGTDDGNGNDPNCDADACVTAEAPPDVQTEDTAITCATIAPTAPTGPDGPVSVAANVQLGQQEQATTGQESVIAGQQTYLLNSWMYQQFQTGGPQDYKNQPWAGASYTDFGNFNYGAVCGAVGFPLTYCQSAAGIGLIGRVARLNATNAVNNYIAGSEAVESGIYSPTQGGATYTGSGIPFVSAPYGDQAGDSQLISQGYAYQAQGCSD